MKKLAFTACMFLALIMSVSMMASPRTRQQALQIAQNQAKSLGVLSPTQVTTDKDVAPYFVFNNGNDKGWTIVSGDDRMTEVLAYSNEGTFDIDDLPEPVQMMLAGIEKCYNNLGTTEEAINTATESETSDNTILKAATSSTTTSPIGPLCVTKWDQYEPYSNNCPTVSSGKHAATCCVATAFAQILYYLYYTKGKQESTTFTTAIPTPTNTAGYKGSAVAASDRTYNWSLMLTDYAGKDYTDEQAAAIAKLMADIGSSFNVKYGTTDSNSTTDDYMSSLTSSSYPSSVGPTYWGIAKPSDLSYNGSVSSVSTWHTAIDGELDKYYPVQIGGNGHAFVCDGRDSNNMYHMNFGYDGRGDGFYSFDAINGYGTSMRITYGMRVESTYPTTGLDKLQVVYDAAVAYAKDEPVGEVPGYYRQEYYDALQTKLAEAKTALDNNGNGMTDDELVTLGEEISTAEQNMIAYRYPYPTGTYYLKSYDDHSGTDVVIYASGTSAKYGPISTSNDNYKWEITYNEASNGYQIKNVGTGTYINSSNSSAVTLGSSSTVYTEITPVNRIEETNSRFTNSYWDVNYATTLRPITSSMASSPTFIVIGYTEGCNGSTSGSLIGWHPYNDWDVWIPVPIDVDYSSLEKPTASFASSTLSIEPGSTATNKLTTNSTGEVTYTSSNTAVATVDSNGTVTAVAAGSATITAKIAKTDTYSSVSVSYTVKVESATLRAQLDALIATAQSLYTAEELAEAKAAATSIVGTDGLITASTQFSSPYTETSEGSFANLLDNSASTFWHSNWSDGIVSAGTHYFIVELNDAEDDAIRLSMTRRSSATDDHVTQFEVYGSNDNSTWTDITTLDFEYKSAGETVTSDFTLGASYKYLKFVCTNTYVQSTTNSGTTRGYFHMGEFQLYHITTTYPSDQEKALIALDEAVTTAKNVTYATQEAIDALQKAINEYKGYSTLPDPVIKFKELSITLTVGTTATNTMTTDSDGAVTYSSSDTSVATVDANGNVTAVNAGTATITATVAATETYNEGKESYTVTVTALPVPTASFEKESITLAPTETATNKLTTSSTGAVTYSSSDEKVATVDANCLVTAVAEGTATITATIAAAGGYSSTTASFSVTVLRKDQEVTFAQSSLTVEQSTTATNKATTTGDGVITYESSNESIATVDENGVVTGVGIGTAKITATAAATAMYDSSNAVCTVNVIENTTSRSELDALLADAKTLYTDEELAAAQNAGVTIKGDGLITSSSQFSSPYTDSTEGSLDNLLDGDATTYWHSTYQGGNVTAGTHYIQVALNSAVSGSVEFDITRRDHEYSGDSSWGNEFTSLKVTYSTDGTTWTDGETISTPYSTSGESFANTITLPEGTLYVRVYFMATNTGKGYSHIGDMQLYQLTTTPASDDDQAIINLNDAITAAEAVSPATPAAIEDLNDAIDDYYSKTKNLKLIDGRVYIARSDGSYESASYTRSVSNTWGTICLPYAITSNSDYQLYIPTTISNGSLSVTPATTVEAGTPAILKRLDSSATSITFEATTPSDVKACTYGKSKDYGGIDMAGTYRRLTDQQDIYYIAEDAFWRADSENTVNVQTYRSWLVTNDGSDDGSMLTIVVVGETDGINNITFSEDTKAYNIAGQRVITPQKGQIVIINGKKVMVK